MGVPLVDLHAPDAGEGVDGRQPAVLGERERHRLESLRERPHRVLLHRRALSVFCVFISEGGKGAYLRFLFVIFKLKTKKQNSLVLKQKLNIKSKSSNDGHLNH